MVDYDFSKYFEAGEILNPDFEEIKRKWNRIVEKEFEEIKAKHRPIRHPYDDFIYFIPTVLNISQLKNKMKFFDDRNEIERDIMAFYVKYAPMSEDFKRLKGIVKTTVRKREETKERKREEFASKCQIDPLTVALMTRYKDFIDGAKRIAGEVYDEQRKYLEENGGLSKVAPYPSMSDFTSDRTSILAGKRVTTRHFDEAGYNGAKEKHESYKMFVTMKREEYVEMNGKQAHESFMAWICKMAAKIGKKVLKADMTGVDPWAESVLAVETEGGDEQIWHTRMIINRSKYGKMFHQFPSRRVR